MKKQCGITLISLVVTIIVLIILAGISINLILGQDGIINKTKEAKQNMEYAQLEEETKLNELYSEMDSILGSSDSSYNSIEKLIDFKKALADYIESKNVERPETSGDASVYINSFEEVLSLATKVDETTAASADNISENKQAWVNGELITGTLKNIDVTLVASVSQDAYGTLNVSTVDIKSITDNYKNLTTKNFFIADFYSNMQINTATGTSQVSSGNLLSYNASSGILTIKNIGFTQVSRVQMSWSAKIYMID